MDLRNGAKRCEITAFPVDKYEYGFKYNGAEVNVADCLLWNVGLRFINRHPYMVNSDNPSAGTHFGGAVFYTETNSADDDVPSPCASNTWRHQYWRLTATGISLDLFSNGCLNQPVFCRRR